MKAIFPKTNWVAGYYRNPSDPPEGKIIVVVQSHLSKVGQNDLSDVRLKEVLLRGLLYIKLATISVHKAGKIKQKETLL